MKETCQELKLEVIEFETEDVINASNPIPGQGGGEDTNGG